MANSLRLVRSLTRYGQRTLKAMPRKIWRHGVVCGSAVLALRCWLQRWASLSQLDRVRVYMKIAELEGSCTQLL